MNEHRAKILNILPLSNGTSSQLFIWRRTLTIARDYSSSVLQPSTPPAIFELCEQFFVDFLFNDKSIELVWTNVKLKISTNVLMCCFRQLSTEIGLRGGFNANTRMNSIRNGTVLVVHFTFTTVTLLTTSYN
jgi:hypothetical protein